MIIATTTITSSRREIIQDALKSVPWADLCILIDVGIGDGTVEAARQIVGDRLRVVTYTGNGTMADMRNFALDTAHELGATWACTLDTDERMHARVDVRAALKATKADCLLVEDQENAYTKERFFRLPTKTRFTGICHERAGECAFDTLRGVWFTELTKSPEVLAERYAFIEREMLAALERNLEDARAWFHLGDAQFGTGRHSEALGSFANCALFSESPEEAAWACFRAAVCWDKLGRYQDGIRKCAEGLCHHPGCAELAWLAGYLCLRDGKPEQAIYWARMSLANGRAEGIGHLIPRIFYHQPQGLWEGPYEILAIAQEALGNHEAARTARKLAKRAADKRGKA